MSNKNHWDHVYTAKSTTSVSWFESTASQSLCMLRTLPLYRASAIIDVGGGASHLTQALLADGFQDLTVLDISACALELAQQALGAQAAQVQWIVADVTDYSFVAHRYQVWHDRAVFHFLITPAEKTAYKDRAYHAIQPDGFLVISTFAEDGPTQCSQLPITRYTIEQLATFFAPAFQLIDATKDQHVTPSGSIQQFVHCIFQKTGDI